MKKTSLSMLYLLSLFLPISACSDDGEYDRVPLMDEANFVKVAINSDTMLLQDKVRTSSLRGMSVGVFGGSFSVMPASDTLYSTWRRLMKWDISLYGHGGHGFSSLQGSIQTQVDSAAVHDIYILWASTNDFGGSREVGTPYDYTVYDGYDITRLVTQCGGINYCIKALRAKNPAAHLFFFGSARSFFNPACAVWSSSDHNELGYNLASYVNGQMLCCALQEVPFYDQFHNYPFDGSNYTLYYDEDAMHMNAQGYSLITYPMLEWILQHGQNK